MTGKMDAQGLKKLDRMLELQDMTVSLKKDEKAPWMVVFFMDDGLYVFLAGEALDEIDFADVYAGTGFIGFCVNERGRDHWTPAPAKSAEKQIKHDLTYDYNNVLLYMQRVPGGNEYLQFRCAIADEDLGMDKISKFAKLVCQSCWFGFYMSPSHEIKDYSQRTNPKENRYDNYHKG